MSFRTALILATAMACVATSALRAEEAPPVTGEEAPDFTLPNAAGEDVTLSELRGENSVLLAFYPRDFTPG